jgi:transposase
VQRRFTPRREWAPLSDREWAALAPFVARPPGVPGRPLLGTDPRARMDAMLHAAVSGDPWRALPEHHGKGATVARHFRRLAHAGLWSRLLEALADPRAPAALRGMEHWLCRAARRAMRLLRMGGIVLARRLGLLSALPMWPWMMPDPDLSRTVRGAIEAVLARLPGELPPPGGLTSLGAVLAVAGGRQVWSKKFAPP